MLAVPRNSTYDYDSILPALGSGSVESCETTSNGLAVLIYPPLTPVNINPVNMTRVPGVKMVYCPNMPPERLAKYAPASLGSRLEMRLHFRDPLVRLVGCSVSSQHATIVDRSWNGRERVPNAVFPVHIALDGRRPEFEFARIVDNPGVHPDTVAWIFGKNGYGNTIPRYRVVVGSDLSLRMLDAPRVTDGRDPEVAPGDGCETVVTLTVLRRVRSDGVTFSTTRFPILHVSVTKMPPPAPPKLRC